MKFSIISLASLATLVSAIPTTINPENEIVETLESRGKEYHCATPSIWYDNSGKSSAWARDCANLAKQLDRDWTLHDGGWNMVGEYLSCVYGVRRLDTASSVDFNRKDGVWIIEESLEKFKTGDDGLGASGEWKCDKSGGGKASVQFWIGHVNEW